MVTATIAARQSHSARRTSTFHNHFDDDDRGKDIDRQLGGPIRTCQQIATMLVVSVSAVSKAERQALKKLRQAICEQADEAGMSAEEWLAEGNVK